MLGAALVAFTLRNGSPIIISFPHRDDFGPMDIVPHGKNDCREVDPLPRVKFQPRERDVCSLEAFHRHHLARLSVLLLCYAFNFSQQPRLLLLNLKYGLRFRKGGSS